MLKLFKHMGLMMAVLFSALSFANGGEPVANTVATDAQVWAQLQQGVEGYTASKGQFHNQAIQAPGVVPATTLIDARLDYLAPALFAALFGMIAVFIIFIKINGVSKLHHGFSGKMVYRWSKFDVAIHWIGAIPCLLLILTGLILLGGRLVLPEMMGGDAWGALVSLAKEAHDVLAIPFMVGWLLMVVLWAKNQIPAMYDIKWFMVVGGYINFGPFKGKHPDAGFANAGEKLWFWTFAAFGALISATGMVLLFPNLFDITRDLSLLALIVHGVAAIVICAFSIVHIFMATIMSEGGMDCMISGYCDENWATQHHNLWFDEIKADGTLKYKD